MYHAKRIFIRHIEENLLIYIIVLCLFTFGVAWGFVFSHDVSDFISESVNDEINTLIEGVKGGSLDKTLILKASFFKNLRIFSLVFVSGISVFFIPLGFVMLFSYGFSIGFTVGYMSLYLGRHGLLISLISVAGTLLVSIPIYIIYAVVAYNNCRIKNPKKNGWVLYVLISVVLFLLSNFSVFADGFVLSWFLTLTCS